MDKKEQQKALSYIRSLKKRSEKLLAEANKWEVRPNIRKRVISKRMKEIGSRARFFGLITRLSLKPELTKKEKKQLLLLTRRRLNTLKKHFLSVYNIIQKNPGRFWDRKIEATERALEERLTLYEKVVPLLFRKKDKH